MLKRMLRVEPSHTGAPHCRTTANLVLPRHQCRFALPLRTACLTRHIHAQAAFKYAMAGSMPIIPYRTTYDVYMLLRFMMHAVQAGGSRGRETPRLASGFSRFMVL